MADRVKEKKLDLLINRDYLIAAVEERPVLWNKFLDIYKDRTAKSEAWREICLILKDDFEDMEPRNRQLFVKCVIKRWTQIRDAWVKTMQKNSKNANSGTSLRRPYKYEEELAFLKPVVQPRDNTDVLELDEVSIEENDHIQINFKEEIEEIQVKENNYEITDQLESSDEPCTTHFRKRKFKSETDTKMSSLIDQELKRSADVLEIEEVTIEENDHIQINIKEEIEEIQVKENNYEITDQLESSDEPCTTHFRKRKFNSETDTKMSSLMKRSANENDERNLTFFKSLLPSIRVFDDEKTLEFHSGVINLIQNIKRRTT